MLLRSCVLVLAAVYAIGVGSGCATIPKRRIALDSVELQGNDALDDDEIEAHTATQATPRFLGVFSGMIYDYQIFDRYVLERDLQRIERYYRARGFYQARVRAGRVFTEGRHAKVQILIEEGPPTVVTRIDVHGLDGVTKELAETAREAVTDVLSLGERFEEEAFLEAEERLRHALGDAGYARARVERAANVDLTADAASVGFWVEPGRPAVYGEITITGLAGIPEEPVRRALDLSPGQPYSQSELDDAKSAVLELGVFSSVNVEAVTPETGEARDTALPEQVPIRVSLEPTPLRSVTLGGGVEADSLKTNLHLTAGWESRNFLGGLRSFRAEVVPGVVLWPTRLPLFQKPSRLLPEIDLRSEFRQPGSVEARTSAVLRGQGSIHPVLLSTRTDAGAPLLGYRDARGSAGLERSFWRFATALSHNVQLSSPFTYQGTLDPDLDSVFISYPELLVTLYLTDRRVSPHAGLKATLDLQTAGVGGDARDIKLEPELDGYIPLGRRVTLATSFGAGLLFPQNYGSTLVSNARTRSPGPFTRAEWVRDIQLTFLRGFFAGGAGSNRGYAQREIGPHGAVPFYNPGQTAEDLSGSCTTQGAPRSASCELPLGGVTLWKAAVELRFPLLGPLGGVTFIDAADVSPRLVDFRWNRPHASAGAGLRYGSPIGPVRFDLGWRLPGLQLLDGDWGEASPGTVFGLPIALSFGVGEAF